MKPNLFKWATSELTQDAFICWLIEWAKPENKEEQLNQIALKLIEEISDIKAVEIEKLEVKRQYKNIDILVVVNDKKAILIEDKVHTKNHGNQLVRYAELLEKEFEKDDISLVYFKTGDQSNYRKVIERGYRTYKRNDFLRLLKSGKEKGIENDIFLDFLRYLENIDASVNSYQNLPLKEWHWDSWKGFYIELQKRLGQGDWGYVHQKNGGFLGFWWHWEYMDYKESGFDFYLQLEHGKFCFKIIPNDVQLNQEIRNYYRNILFQFAQKNDLAIKRNGRCIKGKTKTMTVAKLSSSYIQTDSENRIDLDKTIKKIKRIENVMKQIKTAHNNG